MLHGGCDHAIDLIGLRHIDCLGKGAYAMIVAQPGGLALCLFPTALGDDHIRASSGERAGNALPHALPAAGYECGAPFQKLLHLSSPVIFCQASAAG